MRKLLAGLRSGRVDPFWMFMFALSVLLMIFGPWWAAIIGCYCAYEYWVMAHE